MTETEMKSQMKAQSIAILEQMADKAISVGYKLDKSFIKKVKFSYGVRGRVGGRARGHAELMYNMDWVRLNTLEKYMNHVIPHECAHIIADAIKTQAGVNSYIARTYTGHGKLWKNVMGLGGYGNIAKSRTSEFEVKKVRKTRKFEYKLNENNTTWLGAIRHNRTQEAGKALYLHGDTNIKILPSMYTGKSELK